MADITLSDVQYQITRVTNGLQACFQAIRDKGVEVPTNATSDDLYDLISQIQSNTATFVVTSDTSGATVWAEKGSNRKDATASGSTYTINGIDEYDEWTIKGTSEGTTLELAKQTVDEATTYNVSGKFKVTITVTAGSNGKVSGGGTVLKGSSVTISATPNDGYDFEKWSDGNTSASRTLTNVQADATYTASFKKQSSCLVEGTLINMPDGTKKPVEQVVNWSDMMSWDFETGKPVVTPVTPMDKDIVPDEYDVIYLNFDDGKRIGYVDEHWFFSRNAMEFVKFDRENAESYIGTEFVKIDRDSWTTNTLVSVDRVTEITTVYSPVNFKHMNIIADDMINMAADLKGMFNYFDVDPETMAWYPDRKAADIEKYGLMTIEDMGGELDQDAMDAFSVQYLKVSMGKGLIDEQLIQRYIDRYLPNLYMNEANDEEAHISESEQVRDTDMESEVENTEETHNDSTNPIMDAIKEEQPVIEVEAELVQDSEEE